MTNYKGESEQSKGERRQQRNIFSEGIHSQVELSSVRVKMINKTKSWKRIILKGGANIILGGAGEKKLLHPSCHLCQRLREI